MVLRMPWAIRRCRNGDVRLEGINEVNDDVLHDPGAACPAMLSMASPPKAGQLEIISMGANAEVKLAAYANATHRPDLAKWVHDEFTPVWALQSQERLAREIPMLVLRIYTTEGLDPVPVSVFYKEVNRRLRALDSTRYLSRDEYLDALGPEFKDFGQLLCIASGLLIPEQLGPVEVYRGMPVDPAYIALMFPGRLVSLPSFTSTSLSEEVAKTFAKGIAQNRAIIHVRSYMRGVIGDWSAIPGEREVGADVEVPRLHFAEFYGWV